MDDFVILALPGAYPTSVAVTLDILHAAKVLAPRLAQAQPRWRVVSPDGGTVALSGGLSIASCRMPRRDAAQRSTWVIPGLGLDGPSDISSCVSGRASQRAIARLKQHVASGGTVAASCSAVFLLQAAGLLNGRRATTAWWLGSELRRREPNCTVDTHHMVVSDGPVTTAGAAFSQSDLMLHLIRERFSPALADTVGKVLLIDGRLAQSPFVVPMMLAHGNALIGRLAHLIESALPLSPSVTDLAKACAMSPRTLARHVKAATGGTPLALIQAVRLSRARMLIESSKISVERVAAEVGYRDATALRRLMQRVSGSNPSAFRSAACWR